MAWSGRAPGGRGAPAPWSDARPSEDGGPSRVPPDERDRRRRVRRGLTVVVFASAFLAGTAVALLAEGGYFDRLEAERDLRVAEDRLFERAARVRELRARLDALHAGPEPLERIAREQLDYVRPGEITFLLPDDDPYPGESARP